MCPAPQSPIGDVLDEEPARGSTTSTGRPALVIDANAGLLLDANREGWALWASTRQSSASDRHRLRHAPLQRLREMARAQADPSTADIPGVLDGAWLKLACAPSGRRCRAGPRRAALHRRRQS
jgi:hypothetical protein